jgi:hypothetical protein
MARITTSALISDIRGKVGGVVFQGGQSGLVARQKTTPINKRTSAQTRAKTDLYNIQQDWMTLTDQQRDNWNLFAATYPKQQKFNPTKYINGQQYFIKYNTYRKSYNLPVLADVSFTIPSLQAIDISVFNFASNLFILANRRLDPNNEFMVLFLSFEAPASITNAGNRRKLIAVPTGYFNNLIATTYYNNVFGRLPDVGTEVFYKVAMFSRNTAHWTSFTEGKATIQQNFGIGFGVIGSTFVIG